MHVVGSDDGDEMLSRGVWRLGWRVVEGIIPLYTDYSSIDFCREMSSGIVGCSCLRWGG
jgi:hypothetical protein